MRRLLLSVAALASIFAAFPVYAATSLTVQGGTGTSSPSGILYGDNAATSHLNTVTIGSNLTFVAGVLSASSGGSSFPFTPTSYGNSTSTLLNLLAGFMVNFGSSTITGNLTINGNSTTTNATTTTLAITGTASTTKLTIGNSTFVSLLGSGLSNALGVLNVSGLSTSNFTSANVSQFTNDASYSTYPFSTASNFGQTVVASTTANRPIFFQSGLYASSTLIADNATTSNATTTSLALLGRAKNCNTTNVLTTDSTGQVTCTAQNYLATDPNWNYTQATVNYIAPTSTSVGILVTASSTIGNGAQTGGLTVSGGATTSLAFSAGANGFNVSNTGAITKVGNGSVNITSAFVQLLSNGGNVLVQNNSNAANSTITIDSGASANDPSNAVIFKSGNLERARITGNGLFAFGTSSPYLSIFTLATANGSNGATTTLFMIASSTIQGATTTLFQINNIGIASTTGLVVSNAGGTAGCATFSVNGTISNTGVACGTGGGGFDFTPTTYGSGVAANGTSSILIAYQGLVTSTSTVGTIEATTSITNRSVKSALVLNSATGLEGAYAGSAPCSAGQVALSISATGVLTCTAASTFGFPWTPATNFAVNFNSTTTPIWLKNPVAGTVSLAASSTSWFDQISVGSTTQSKNVATSTFFGSLVASGNASTTSFTISNTGTGGTKCLQADATGNISAGAATCNTSGVFEWTPINEFGVNTNGTSTILSLLAGLNASSTVNFGNAAGPGLFTFTGTTGNTLFTFGSSTSLTVSQGAFFATTGSSVGVASTTPFSKFSVGTGLATSSITVAEYKYGLSTNAATSTAANIDCNASNQIAWPLGTAASTLTLINLTQGKKCIVVVQNAGAGTAGAITWALPSGFIFHWVGGGNTNTVPRQTTTANATDVWSFLATQGSSTILVEGGISAW